ncbi:MAG: hypothetical protein MZW92_35055 [Comamonadaceae bacterium]|nr:hypothetical protein [Comamonadaceae bacterium]
MAPALGFRHPQREPRRPAAARPRRPRRDRRLGARLRRQPGRVPRGAARQRAGRAVGPQPLPLELAGERGGVWAAPVAFLGCFFVRAGCSPERWRCESSAPCAAALQQHVASRTLGLVPGAANGAVNAAIAALLLLTLPLSDAVTLTARDSRLADALAAPAAWLGERLSPIFEPAVDRLAAAPRRSSRGQSRVAAAGLHRRAAAGAPRPGGADARTGQRRARRRRGRRR